MEYIMQKKFFFTVLFIVCLTFTGSCNREPYDLHIEHEILDFGKINEGEDADLVFKIKNTGTEDLEILTVKPTCGCTAAEDWDKVIKSGKTGQIPITFHSTHYQGDVTKVVNITTNVPGKENIPLTLKGNVFVPVLINPKSSWLGEVKDDTQPLHGTFELTNNRDEAMVISEIIPQNKHVEYNLVTLVPGQKYRLDFTVNPPFERDEIINETVSVLVNNGMEKRLEHTYSYQIPPPIAVNPKKIMLDLNRVSEKMVDRRINIKNNTELPIEILDLQLDGEGIEYYIDVLSENRFIQIALQFPQGFTFPAEKPVYTVTFRVKNDPRDLLYAVTLEGYVPGS